jgi:hypothetical protein
MIRYPAGHFGLFYLLKPAVCCIANVRYDYGLPQRTVDTLGYANSVLDEVIMDDELGLIDATPEERVRRALKMKGERDA